MDPNRLDGLVVPQRAKSQTGTQAKTKHDPHCSVENRINANKKTYDTHCPWKARDNHSDKPLIMTAAAAYLVTLNWDCRIGDSRQEGVQRRNNLRTFANRRGNSLHRFSAHVADRKYAATRRF